MNDKKFLNISDLSKKLDLVDPVSNKPLNHVLRYWEKEFKQIKPKILNNRRYYSSDMIEIIKLIKFLLKDKGMTINGVKNILNKKINKLDDYYSDSLKTEYYKKSLKDKSKKVLKKIRDLRKYGKKNSFKS
tara:strand:+ start:832 stop:1224 length:393 start_codon:yes stop_codon:yes gene_type:complete